MTQTQQNVLSDAYLLGISEARGLLKSNPDLTLTEMHNCLANAKTSLTMGYAQPMRDTFRGERDFWALQIKRKTTEV